MFQRGLLSLLFGLVLCAASLEAHAANPVAIVQAVDLKQFAGKWFEIARIENEFQIGCRGTTATYSLLPESKDSSVMDVSNDCWVGDENQKRLKSAQGRAWAVKNSNNAKLKISFVHFGFWWKVFANDYWVLELGPLNEAGEYSWALIGHPKRRYAWIMNRTPQMDPALFDEVMGKAASFGYDRKDFRLTDQKMNLAQ